MGAQRVEQEAVQVGKSVVDVVDFGRSRPESGVHGFKKGFGGRRSPLASVAVPSAAPARAR